MQINYDDICFIGELAMQEYVNDCIRKELKSSSHLTETRIVELKNRYASENILNTEHSMEVLKTYVCACIAEYHDQLRNIIKEQMSVDIGEVDYDTVPGEIRTNYLKMNEDH